MTDVYTQTRSFSSVKGNNNTYRILNSRLNALLPYFEAEQYEIYNCTPDSGLHVFPQVDYEDAIEESVSVQPPKIITQGMYDRNSEENKAEPNARLNLAPKREEGSGAENTSSHHLPEFTVVIPVDSNSVKVLSKTWQTWVNALPEIANAPHLIIHGDDVDPTNLLPEELKLIDDIKFVLGWEGSFSSPSEYCLDALVKKLSENVLTPWYLKIDPEAIAQNVFESPNPDWFRPAKDGTQVAFIAPQWRYSKPANVMSILDEWGDQISDLATTPRLDIPAPAEADRVYHDAVSSWCLWGNTRWTQEVTKYFDDSFPPERVSHASYLYYCAARKKDSVIRAPFKDQGWDHSFGRRSEEICRRADQILKRQIVGREI